jgi:DNA ligase-4
MSQNDDDKVIGYGEMYDINIQDKGDDEESLVVASRCSNSGLRRSHSENEDINDVLNEQVPRFESFMKQHRQQPAENLKPCEDEAGLDGKKANAIPFRIFCEMANELRFGERGTGRKLDQFRLFLSANGLLNPSQKVFPIFRLLLSDDDNLRSRYFIKEQTLARLYSIALCLPLPLAERLYRYNDPRLNNVVYSGSNQPIQNGHFPSVLAAVLINLRYSPTSQSAVTCSQINEYLDRIHDAIGINQKAMVLRELIFSLRLQSPLEHAWLARIILKVGSGVDRYALLRTYHLDAPRGLHITGDLRKVLAVCSKNLGIKVSFTFRFFSPGRPMLASRVQTDQATAKLGDFIIEEKMDGDRIMVHLDKANRHYRFFSRHQKDFTYVYGVPELVSALFETFDCIRCVLDGEMLAYDARARDIIRNGKCNNLSIARELFGECHSLTHRWLCYFPFDILMVQHKGDTALRDLTDLPLWERKMILSSIFKGSSESCQFVKIVQPMKIVRNCSDTDARHREVMLQLDATIRTRREGIVLKSLDSRYSLDGRSPAWVKIKPDYGE